MGKTGEADDIPTSLIVLTPRQLLEIVISLLKSGRIHLTVEMAVAFPHKAIEDTEALPADCPITQERMRVLTNPPPDLLPLLFSP